MNNALDTALRENIRMAELNLQDVPAGQPVNMDIAEGVILTEKDEGETNGKIRS
jgi:hypothetical protein